MNDGRHGMNPGVEAGKMQALPMWKVFRLDQCMDVVRHHAPCDKTVAYAVEMQQGVLCDSRQIRAS